MFTFHKSRLQLLPLVLILLFALVLSGCTPGNNNNGGSGTNTVPETGSVPNTGNNAEATTVNVSMTTYAFQLDNPNVPAGPVTFHVTNDADDMGHEFILLKTDLTASELPTNANGVVEEETLESLGEVEAEIGESKDLTVDLVPGHYVILCNEPGHYANGMVLDLTVQ